MFIFKNIFYAINFIISSSFSLDVDEKLPLRILNVSDSKKTILVNRGIEDGLVEGDHAKFFLTTGVISRGILIKGSPSRSVWSLYRIVNSDEIAKDKVMNLKITPPVKLTIDPTKMLKKYEDPLGEEKEIVLNDPEMPPKDSTTTTKQMSEIPTMSEKNWELYSVLHLSSLTNTNSLGNQNTGTKGPNSTIDLIIGIEKYFSSFNSWYSPISFSPYLHINRQTYTSIQGHRLQNNFLGYGLSVHYHFFNHPLSLNVPLPWFHAGFGIGTSSDSAYLEIDTSSTTAINTPVSLKGTANFFFLGTGLKYNFHDRWGGRFIIDYYNRGESYKINQVAGKTLDPYTKKIAGFRLLLGASLRF